MTDTLPLPEPDTHCYDEDEQRDVWSHSPAQMHAYTAAAVAAEREKWRSTELDVLAVYSGAGQRRQWANAGAWLYPGDVLAVVSERATNLMQRGTLSDGTPVMGTVYEVLNDYRLAAEVEARLGDEARAECALLRADAELLAWVLTHPETAAECLEDAAAGDGTARDNLEFRRIGLAARATAPTGEKR